jgi:hypothetical protein
LIPCTQHAQQQRQWSAKLSSYLARRRDATLQRAQSEAFLQWRDCCRRRRRSRAILVQHASRAGSARAAQCFAQVRLRCSSCLAF